MEIDSDSPSSAIGTPLDGAYVGGTKDTVAGTAYDATSGIRKVEVSTDGGSTWNSATDTSGDGSWSTWSYDWTLPADGSYTIKSRATDNAGNVETPGAGVTVTVGKRIELSRDTINLTCAVDSPPATATVDVTSSYGILNVTATSDSPWLTVSPPSGLTPRTLTLSINPAGQTPGFIIGHVTASSPLAGNSPAVITVNVTITSYGASELPHADWDAWLTGGDCAVCHQGASTFLPAGYRDEPGFCRSCHNASAPAHDRNLLGTREHSMFASVTTAGCRMPVYGDMTSAEYDNRMSEHLMDGDKVVCVTCHNPMRKSEDYGRVWELTITDDNKTYYMEKGGWQSYGSLVPAVYRDTSLWFGPAYVKDKKDYLVDKSEYTYDEAAGSVTFNTSQSPAAYVYVTLDYPYLRVSTQANRICSDCHTESTHRGANCLTCHGAHNTDNLGGIRETVRTADRSERAVVFINITGNNSFADGDGTYDGICEVCHTQTLYHKRDGGASHYGGEDCTACHSHASGFAR